MSAELTQEQKEYIEVLFMRFTQQMNEQYDNAIKEELLILSKYKAGLAKSYDEVRGQRNALVDCMRDIITFQEAIAGQLNQMATFINRIEQFFMDDVAPKGK